MPSFAPQDGPSTSPTYTIIAPSDAQAKTAIANQESLLQHLYSLKVGDTITTINPATGINSVVKTPVGQNTAVPVNLTVARAVVAFTPGPAASFALSLQAVTPANSLEQVTVTALDGSGNVATGYTGTVTFVPSNPNTLIGGHLGTTTYTFTPAEEGSHTFAVHLDTAGIQMFTVTDTSAGTLTGQGLVDITPLSAVSLVINTPGTDTVGAANPITITALDMFGNVASGYVGTVSLSIPTPGARITRVPGNYTFTSADHGSHLFPVTFKTTGGQTIVASDSQNANIEGGQAQLQVSAAPAKLVIKTQPPATVTAGQGFDLTALAVDSHGKVVSNFNGLVTLKLVANPGHTALEDSVALQAVNGVADFAGLTLNRAGVGYTLGASSGSIPAATTRAFNVRATTASQFVVIAQPPSKVTAGNFFGLKVAAEDAYGNVVSSYTGSVTLTLTSGPLGAILAGKLTVPLVKGVATFSGLKATVAGAGYSLTASGSLGAATTRLFTVTPRGATQLEITTQPPASVTAGSAFGLVVTALDAYGNVATSFTGKVTLALASDPGLSKLTGKVTVQAVAGVSTFTDLVLNNPGLRYRLKATSGMLTEETDEFSVAS